MNRNPRIVSLFAGLLLATLCGCGQRTVPGDDVGAENSNTVEPDVGPDAVERPALQLRAATFNTSRFFDTVCDSNNCGDSSFERQLSDAEFSFKADQIAGAIELIDADAVMLQEIEKRECLDAIVERVPEYTVAEFGEIGDTASLDVAVIARGVTHLETRTHRSDTQLMLEDGRTKRFTRELLEVHVESESRRIALFSAHFKSRRNDDPEWRLAEAERAREIAEATSDEFPDAFVLLGGDLNSEPGSPELEAMTERGGLRLAAADLPPDDAWTFSFFGDHLSIDHLLYVPTEAGRVIDDSAEVVRDPGGSLGGSDHAALAAEFNVWLD